METPATAATERTHMNLTIEFNCRKIALNQPVDGAAKIAAEQRHMVALGVSPRN